MSQFSAAVFTSLSEENLVPHKCFSNFGKGNSHWAIVKPSDANVLVCRVMVSSSCMPTSILLAKLKNCCSNSYGMSVATHSIQPRFGIQSGFQTLICDFYQSRLTKLVLCSDKCINKFGDYAEK
ncbi:hypothetical protein AVEN_70143-1 [Araneus ventricosus]|uniref:Uncharacterized protein n=1 Tax=Araneus ventricosus TaxID=182803 RepID=A0A4Y2WLL1_ARAVE|nr:hypothetical protein AVEN_70143-1 [Araneus ventricosus]